MQEHTIDPVTPDSAPARQGRPRLQLSDDQARSLVLQVEALKEKHANNPGQHRPFVHDFVRAVYHATGQTFSAAFYRKLLHAYAPGRTPSTPTIESEKLLLIQELQRNAGAVAAEAAPSDAVYAIAQNDTESAPFPPDQRGTDLAMQQALTLLHQVVGKVEQLAIAPAGPAASMGLQAHNDYLRERLANAESEVASLRAQTARLASGIQEAMAVADERGQQLLVAQQAAAVQVAAMEKLTTEMTGMRQFAMQAIDAVRGETRAYKERVAYLEGLLKEADEKVEMYRRMAMNKGADNQSGGAR